jgi:FMN phosphatase YigB (HAD superfamily)
MSVTTSAKSTDRIATDDTMGSLECCTMRRMSTGQRAIPYADVDTVFLDVGNTLISIDFDWVAAELGSRGVRTTAESLRRAEAGARPKYSRRLFVDGVAPGTDLFRTYLIAMIEALPAALHLSPAEFDALITELRRVLRPDGRASVLWRSVMPGVPEALGRLQALGLRLVVVSNSDGTVEQSLVDAGLRTYMTLVVDSALAGVEKPDPRIFLHALESAGALAGRTLHVGDIYHADVVGARAAGIHALLLDPYDDWNGVDCPTARHLSEVADVLAANRQ